MGDMIFALLLLAVMIVYGVAKKLREDREGLRKESQEKKSSNYQI